MLDPQLPPGEAAGAPGASVRGGTALAVALGHALKPQSPLPLPPQPLLLAMDDFDDFKQIGKGK